MIKCERCGGGVKSIKMMEVHLTTCPSPIPRYQKKVKLAPPALVPPPTPTLVAPEPPVRKRIIKRQ